MRSVRLEPTKLILIGMRTTYQATGDALVHYYTSIALQWSVCIRMLKIALANAAHPGEGGGSAVSVVVGCIYSTRATTPVAVLPDTPSLRASANAALPPPPRRLHNRRCYRRPQGSRSQKFPRRKDQTPTTSPTRAKAASTARHTSTPLSKPSPPKPESSPASARNPLPPPHPLPPPPPPAGGEERGWCCSMARIRTISEIRLGVCVFCAMYDSYLCRRCGGALPGIYRFSAIMFYPAVGVFPPPPPVFVGMGFDYSTAVPLPFHDDIAETAGIFCR